MNLVLFTLSFLLDHQLVLYNVALLKIHAVVYACNLVIDLVEIVHKLVRCLLLILFITYLLLMYPVFEPLFLLLEIFYLYLLLKEQNLLLLPKTLNQNLALSECSTLICVSQSAVSVKYI